MSWLNEIEPRVRHIVEHRASTLRFIGLVALLSVVVLALRLRLDNSPEIWLPQDDPEVEHYHRFKERFGNDAFLGLVSAPIDLEAECAHFGELVAQLQALPGVKDVHCPVDSQGQRVEPSPATPSLESESGRVVVLIHLPDEASPEEALELIRGLEKVAKSYPKFGPYGLIGNDVITRDLNRGSERSFGGLFPLVAAVLGALVFAALNSVRMVLAIVAAAGLAALAALATLAACGATLNLLVVLMPAILVVLTVATSVHLCDRYLQLAENATQESLVDRRELWVKAVKATIKPCALATVTTALGFLSLAVSQVGPVRDLGLYTAAGSLWVFLSVFVLVPTLVCPAAITVRPRRRRRLNRYVETLARGRYLILVMAAVLFLFAAAGLPQLEVESNVLEFFPPDHPTPQTYRSFEEDFFGLTSFEIIVEGSVGRLSTVNTLRGIRDLVEKSQELGVTREAFSPWLIPEDGLQRSALELKALFQQPPEALRRYLWKAGSSGSLRVTLTAPTGSSNEAYRAVQRLRKLIRSLESSTGLTARVGGAAPLLVRGQVLLLDTQLKSFGLAMILITLMISVGYRSLRLTLLGLVCNVFPVVGTLGLMGWCEIPINAGTVTVAGIALGLIVDDTIHLVHGISEEKSPDSRERLVRTLEVAGRPILITTVAIAIGFGFFSLASFAPTRYFGLLTALTSALALLADLVVLPALLSGDRA